jgi:hypothetical protein
MIELLPYNAVAGQLTFVTNRSSVHPALLFPIPRSAFPMPAPLLAAWQPPARNGVETT